MKIIEKIGAISLEPGLVNQNEKSITNTKTKTIYFWNLFSNKKLIAKDIKKDKIKYIIQAIMY